MSGKTKKKMKKKNEKNNSNKSSLKNKLNFSFLLLIGVLFVLLIIENVFGISWIGSPWLTTMNGTEDSNPSISFNLSEYANATAQETPLRFEFGAGTNISSTIYGSREISFYTWISLDSSTGILTINSTNDNQTGVFNISLDIYTGLTSAGANPFYFNISAVNDAPAFANLENKTFNMSELFTYIVNITDEENNIPFVLNISFLNCTVETWSTRNCSNSSGRELFNSSYYSFNSTSGVLNISFTPQKNDVGSYVINFSVMDNSSLGNKTTSQIVNFTVLNTNSEPYFRYVCDNKRNATEDNEFICWINASDTDENYNLTFSSNYSWFTFYNNSARVSSLSVNCNSSTNYNASAMVNFTANDSMVGNWSINLTITDVGRGNYRQKSNSTVFWFFINNTEDNVSLDVINNITIYENQTIYVNASDNDLLVTQKNFKDEVLTFKSNTSWVNISTYSNSSNYVTAKINFNYDGTSVGNYSVKINVTDTAGTTAERIVIVKVASNNAVQWNSSMDNAFIIYENNLTYFNFTQNVTDPNGDSINFSFVNYTSFPSFSINLTTGIINFTPIDEDVGYHNITINATDGKQNSFKSFNFTIRNINDNPYIRTPLSVNDNTTINSTNSNIDCGEDNLTIITLWVQDEDVKIPSGQKSYYNESFNVTVNIKGVNSSLFSFVSGTSWVGTYFPNRTEYVATFTPRKADVGIYNITINVTDASNFSTSLEFNLTVSSIEHSPVLMSLANQTSAINRNLYYRINASDSEDGYSNVLGGNSNFTFSYNFISGNDFLNATVFNSTTGEINITFNSSQGGKYHLNITVNDSSERQDLDNFWIYVYDIPNITSPVSGYAFYLAENNLSNLTFNVNHTIGDNLTFKIYIQNINGSDVLKYNLSYYGNNTNFTWQFTPNFTEETYGIKNLTLIVLNPIYSNLNTSRVFNITINHTNAPVVLLRDIGDSQADYNNVITINLSTYFSDIDYSDVYYNQTISFNVSSNSTLGYITKSFSNWTLILSSSIAVTELINVTGVDSNSTNATSNTFEIKFTTPSTTPTPTPTSGGGGSTTTPVAFKIITAGEVSAYTSQKITIPLSLENKGNKNFERINITSIAFKDGDIQKEVITSLDKNYISSLKIGSTENLILTVFFDTNNTGDYEILINATSQSPKYTDWAKIYIDLQETNNSRIRELLIFTEELIAKNPECIEITEIVNEARDYFEKGDLLNAKEKAEQAVNSCRESISQAGLPSLRPKSPLTTNEYLIIATLGSMIIGLFYYLIKRRKFKKMILSGEIGSKE